MTHPSVELFTNDEHVVLADWLGTAPRVDSDVLPNVDDALRSLGFVDEATECKRTESDAAVASIALKAIQQRLPQWIATRMSDAGATELFLGRTIRRDETARTVELAPQFLMMIDWASRPGFSWPVAYYLTWVPFYDAYVVTESAESPDMFGYCDFALGHFGEDHHPLVKAAEVIRDDWLWMRSHEQERWEHFWAAGLIDAAHAQRVADDVWLEGEEDED